MDAGNLGMCLICAVLAFMRLYDKLLDGFVHIVLVVIYVSPDTADFVYALMHVFTCVQQASTGFNLGENAEAAGMWQQTAYSRWHSENFARSSNKSSFHSTRFPRSECGALFICNPSFHSAVLRPRSNRIIPLSCEQVPIFTFNRHSSSQHGRRVHH
jgi:hypothetical protein